MEDDSLKAESHDRERLDRLSRRSENDFTYNPAYSKFIKRVRIVLPILAAAAITITVVWSSVQPEDIVTVDAAQAPPTVGKNELLNPNFESTDEKGQPYKITAVQATQDPANEKLVKLSRPSGNIVLNEGNTVTIEADSGEFTQDTRQLLLQGHVKLEHDKGYQLTTAQLAVDLQTSTAQTDTKVDVQGPDGTLQAAGLKGYAQEGHLIFNGPAKLVLTQQDGGTGLGGLIP